MGYSIAMTNPNLTATVETIAFEALKPGDKFAPAHNNIANVVGVCVKAPELVEGGRKWVRRGITFERLDTYTARCVELHQYLGACEWNPKELAGTEVNLLAK